MAAPIKPRRRRRRRSRKPRRRAAESEPIAATAPASEAPAPRAEAEAATPAAPPSGEAAGETAFAIPELGENVKGGDVLRLLVKVGDTVAVDQPLIELETDKATIEVPSLRRRDRVGH